MLSISTWSSDSMTTLCRIHSRMRRATQPSSELDCDTHQWEVRVASRHVSPFRQWVSVGSATHPVSSVSCSMPLNLWVALRDASIWLKSSVNLTKFENDLTNFNQLATWSLLSFIWHKYHQDDEVAGVLLFTFSHMFSGRCKPTNSGCSRT